MIILKEKFKKIGLQMIVYLFILLIIFTPLSLFSNNKATLIKETEKLENEALTTIERTYRGKILNPDFTWKEVETTNTLCLVGQGINYDSNYGQGEPNWKKSDMKLAPSMRTGYIYENTTNPIQTYFPADSSKPIIIAHNSDELEVRYLNTNNSKCKKIDDYTVIYEDVYTDVDIKYTVMGGILKGDIILKSSNCPDKIDYSVKSFTLNATDSKNISLASETNQYAKKLGEGETKGCKGPISFKNSEGNTIFFQPFPKTYDKNDNDVKTDLTCRATSDAKDVTQSIIINKEAIEDTSFPIIIDPESVYNSDPPTEYKSGVTYKICGNIIYQDQGTNVDIRAGAILKFAVDRLDPYYIKLDSLGHLTMYGAPNNYVIVTSAYDDSVGEDTDSNNGIDEGDPASGDYVGFWVVDGCINVDHLKVRYSNNALHSDSYADRFDVRNSIFQDNSDTHFTISYKQIWGDGLFVCINNLFINNKLSIYIGRESCYIPPNHFYVLNNTIQYNGSSSYSKAIYIYNSVHQSFPLEIKYNIISNYDKGISHWNPYPPARDYIINCNAYDNVGTQIDDNITQIDPITLTLNPFIETENGNFYLNPQLSGSNQLVNRGDVNSDYLIAGQSVGLNNLTTTGINILYNYDRLIRNKIENGQSNTWSQIQRDEGNIDIGYHYDPVDYIIKPDPTEYFQLPNGTIIPTISIRNSSTLVINKGVTITFSSPINAQDSYLNQTIYFYNGGGLNTARDQENYALYTYLIRFTSVSSMGERFGYPGLSHTGFTNRMYSNPLQFGKVNTYANPSSVIKGIEVTNAASGIAITQPINNPVYYCNLRDNVIGINVTHQYDAYGNLLHGKINIDECILFHNCFAGIVEDTTYSDWYIRNSTFDSNGHGIAIDHTKYGTITNNIIRDSKNYGIYSQYMDPKDPAPQFSTAKYNDFYQNISGNLLNVLPHNTNGFWNPRHQVLMTGNYYDPNYLNEKIKFYHYFLDQDLQGFDSCCIDTGDPSLAPIYHSTTNRDNYPNTYHTDTDVIDKGFKYLYPY